MEPDPARRLESANGRGTLLNLAPQLRPKLDEALRLGREP
jgi:hypothetical protein